MCKVNSMSIDNCHFKVADIDLAIFGTHNRSKALTSKKYERFARQLFMYDNHTQYYDLLYFKTDAKDKSSILEEISKGEVLYECE